MRATGKATLKASTSNIAGLALGMACFIVIATYLQFELSYDRFHENGNRIFRLVERQFFEGQDEQNLVSPLPG